MRLPHAAATARIALLPSLMSADTTLIYRMEAKANPSLPPAFRQGIGAAFSAMQLSDRTILLRGGKLRTRINVLTMIADKPNGRVILLDTANSHFAEMAASQFLEESIRPLSQAPAAANALLSSTETGFERSHDGPHGTDPRNPGRGAGDHVFAQFSGRVAWAQRAAPERRISR